MSSEQNMFKVQFKTNMLFNKITWFTDPHWAHPFSVIRNDKSKRNKTERDETKQRSEPHKVGGKNRRGTGQNKDVYKYTTNLQIALKFKDPLTSGSDWEGSPSSAVFYDIHVCTKHINTCTKLIENGGKYLSKQCKTRLNKNGKSYNIKAGKVSPI